MTVVNKCSGFTGLIVKRLSNKNKWKRAMKPSSSHTHPTTPEKVTGRYNKRCFSN